jgi:hypothetical protein
VRSLAVTPSVVQDIVNTEEERLFWEVVRHHERPPFHFPEEGVNNRLNLAARLVYEEHVHPQSDGSFQVDGSGGRVYRVADSCSCPASQKSKTKWCKHLVATALYVEWKRRLAPGAPIALGTLRAGTLPLPPVTVDERLALSTMRDATALSTHHTPQEDRMADDGYIPEPETDDAPVTVLERPTPEPAHVTQAVREGHALVAQDDDLEQALTHWTAQRQVVQRFLKQELKANIDYYTLHIGGKASKPSLSKAGAEKVMGWLKLFASFAPDTGTWEMLGRPTDLVCFVCTLRTRSGEIVGEGRGARSIKKDNGDVNKAIKMAEKSANVSAVLRTGCLSDVFTQDLGEDDEEPAKPTTPARTSSQDLRQRIWALVKAAEPGRTSREAVEAYIKERTGMDLHPDFYQAIVNRLEQREGRP